MSRHGTLPERRESAQMRFLLLAEILAQLRQVGIKLYQRAGTDAENMRVGNSSDRKAMGQVAAQQGDVAEMVSRPEPIDDFGGAVGSAGQHFESAGLHYIDMTPGVAFAKYDLTGVELLQHHPTLRQHRYDHKQDDPQYDQRLHRAKT